LRIVSNIADLDSPPGKIGFVPTMGAFHEGHLQLMRRAREGCDWVVVSLFVNPTQFAQGEDFEKYPRDLKRDAALAESVGVDLLFTPSPADMYPRPGATIHVPEVTRRWEGEIRPGHFDGVATVVAKLFNIVSPDTAYFGLKDLQQCMVISRMVEDLNMRIHLSFEPTVRESDGLALSSRNAYLNSEQRAKAPLLYREITRCMQAVQAGNDASVELQDSINTLSDAGLHPDYYEMVGLPDMEPTRDLTGKRAIIAAVRNGQTRLLDNVIL
jgi:pantoate--beta-alanine ligase